MRISQFRGGTISDNNRDQNVIGMKRGQLEWGSSDFGQVSNATSCDTDGMISIRPIRVHTEVTQGDSRIRGEKQGNKSEEERRADSIAPGKV